MALPIAASSLVFLRAVERVIDGQILEQTYLQVGGAFLLLERFA